MRLATREQMQEIDRRSASEFDLTEDHLMEKAGTLMAERIMALPGLGRTHRICVFCGGGHNGGDGLVVARKLFEKGFQHVDVWKVPTGPTSILFELNLRRFQEMKGSVHVLDESIQAKFDFNKYEILIDAIFGTGLSRPLELSIAHFIERITKQNVSVVALDVPTGLDVNTGKTHGACIKAIKTLTCGLAKPGFYLNEGPRCTGEIEILDIGFPQELVRKVADSTFLLGKNSAKALLPRRKSTSNKTHFGHLLLLAGRPGMKGAAELAATAAARMGVGYVTISSPSGQVMKKMPPDFLSLDWKRFSVASLEKYSAVAVGPGLGTDEGTEKVLRRLLEEKMEKVVVDADALTVLSQMKKKDKKLKLPESWVLTPHAGELSRLIGVKAADIEADRLRYAREAQEQWGAAVLLKGFRTVLCVKQKNYIIASGNVALAKAGTGDVLTGFISSLMAQGLSNDRAAGLGAYLHGRIADRWVRKGGSLRTLMASDLLQGLHKVLGEME